MTSLDENAFRDCSKLQSITIPASITKIGANAFKGCKVVNSVTFDNVYGWSVSKTVDGTAQNISISNTDLADKTGTAVNYLIKAEPDGYGDLAWSCTFIPSDKDCGMLHFEFDEESLTASVSSAKNSTGSLIARGDISVPEKVINNTDGKVYSITSVANDGFKQCSSITSISLPKTVTSIGKYAFYYCNTLTSVNIPENVETIGNNAFFANHSLTSITIPENVEEIEENPFLGCINLATIEVAAANDKYKVKDGNLYMVKQGDFAHGTEYWTLIIGSNQSSPNILVANEIAPYAFAYMPITKIVIPVNLYKIGHHAFIGCSKLESASFGISPKWQAGFKTFGGGSSLDLKPLANTETAAKYLKDTYADVDWERL